MNHYFYVFLLSIIIIPYSKSKQRNIDSDELLENNFIEVSQKDIDKKIESTKIKNMNVHLYNEIEKINVVKIDSDGKFKYVQIAFNGKIYIRGFKKCRYHICDVKSFKKELADLDLDKYQIKPLGGGRIKISKKEKTIEIYGYSNRYSRYEKMHSITKELLQSEYSDYSIKWYNKGY